MLRGHAPPYVRFCCYSISTLYMEMQACLNFVSRTCFFKGGVQQILTGKDFERALRGFTLVGETLNKRFIVLIKLWCETYGKVIPEDAYQVGNSIKYSPAQQRRHIYRTQNVFSDMNEKGIKDLQAILEELGRDFLKHVMLPMKFFIASSRLGVLEVNQYAKAKFLPIVLLQTGQYIPSI